VRLLLDENVSPSIVHALREAGHDVYHVRDRGLIGRPDHVIWRRAVAESRVVVTINTHDFVRFARREELHAGLITFPSGSISEQQSRLILRALAALKGRDPLNRWLDVDEDGRIQISDLASKP
jgi:predicted nuclease of predicted toxin-antitoxin system